MSTSTVSKFRAINDFPELVEYLGDELDWPIQTDDFEEMTFDYSAEELGLDAKTAPKFLEIRRLRPLDKDQPWGIFFIRFEESKLPVVALRRLLSKLALKKRSTSNIGDRASWHENDLLLISQTGAQDEKSISFAHFASNPEKTDLPILKVLGWDNDDTGLKIDYVIETLREKLIWPDDPSDSDAWRAQWRDAFTLKNREVIQSSKEMAERLGQLALAVRTRLREVLAIESDEGPIHKLMSVFKENLISDLDTDSFSDMYAQTIAYGLLSARIINPKANTADAAHTQIPTTNPFLRDLMESFLNVGGRSRSSEVWLDFDELGINEVVDLLDNTNMEAVLRDFGDRNRKEDPVMHFFEGFLQEYDSKIRKDRGVFYTPQPVVSFIVRSVDEQLRAEFGLEDGLADTTTWGELAARIKDIEIPEGTSPNQAFVQILDPATGTGTFPVEVIDLIYKTMTAKWQLQGNREAQIKELWNAYVPEQLLPRLHGYELMMAPYAIAHMKIGLKLYETGYRFESDERARVFLTNALEPAQDFSGTLAFAIPALAHEAEAVNAIKQHQRFTVVIGNPPYSGHSSNNQVQWIVNKVHDFKREYPDLQKPGQAKWLQDDYVKFLRYAQWQIELTSHGVVGFVTNHAWLENPTFKGLRRCFLMAFDRLEVLDLHGNANKKELAPDGGPDENVFEIKQGVAIALACRTPEGLAGTECIVQRSDLFGTQSFKYKKLAGSTSSQFGAVAFRPLNPELVFARLDTERNREYSHFIPVPEIMSSNGDPAPGIVTTHDEFAISFSSEEQLQKVEAFLATNSESDARQLFRLCSQSQWVYENAKLALGSGQWQEELTPILYRPFDYRWTIYNRHVAVHRRDRVSKHMLAGHNIGLSIPRATEIRRGWEHVFCTKQIIQHHTVSLKEVNYLFPLWLGPQWPDTKRRANYSSAAIRALEASSHLEYQDEGDADWDGRGDLESNFGPRDVFDAVYSLLHSIKYRERYRDFLKGSFARIPINMSRELFAALVRLGSELTSLHLLDLPALGRQITEYLGAHAEVEKVSYSDETVWIDKAKTRGFKGVPEEVWNFHIGGYQVCEKWLKDRQAKGGKSPRAGRVLTDGDIEHYQKIVVALSETIRIMAEIDEVIEAHGGWPGAFIASGS